MLEQGRDVDTEMVSEKSVCGVFCGKVPKNRPESGVLAGDVYVVAGFTAVHFGCKTTIFLLIGQIFLIFIAEFNFINSIKYLIL